MIEIINMRKQNKLKVGVPVIRVDRASVLGNPFYMHTEAERDEVCNKYEVYFNIDGASDWKMGIKAVSAPYFKTKNGYIMYLQC